MKHPERPSPTAFRVRASRKEVARLLSFIFAGLYEYESLSLRESRALRPGEGLRIKKTACLYARTLSRGEAATSPASGRGERVLKLRFGNDLRAARPPSGRVLQLFLEAERSALRDR